MNKKLLKDALGWGILLWFIGYALGIVLFMIVPPSMIGWILTPIGIALTIFVLLKRIDSKDLSYYILLALIWTTIAIIMDYFFLVQLFKPEDGYYKLDIYIYYASTFILPLLVGLYKSKK